MSFEFKYDGMIIKCHNIHSNMSDISKNIVKTYFNENDEIQRCGIYANDGNSIDIYLYDDAKCIFEKSFSENEMTEEKAHTIISVWVKKGRF